MPPHPTPRRRRCADASHRTRTVPLPRGMHERGPRPARARGAPWLPPPAHYRRGLSPPPTFGARARSLEFWAGAGGAGQVLCELALVERDPDAAAALLRGLLGPVNPPPHTHIPTTDPQTHPPSQLAIQRASRGRPGPYPDRSRPRRRRPDGDRGRGGMGSWRYWIN